MLSIADWAKLTTDEKGRLLVMATAQALSHPRAWPLLRVLPFVPKMGGAYIANRAGASAQAATRAMNVAFTEAVPTVDQFTFAMRAAGGAMKIDRAMIDGDNTGMVEAGMLTQKTMDMGARLNRMWFKGDRDAVSGAEWHGVNEYCADEARTVAAGGNGAVITKDIMDSALNKVPGANLILCNQTLTGQIDGLSTGVQKTVDLSNGGLTTQMFLPTYKGVPILPVLTAPNDTTAVQEEILPFTETQGSSNVCSRITVARIGLDGLYGIQNKALVVDPSQVRGAFKEYDMHWFMAGLCTDVKDAVFQIIGVKAS